MTAPANLRGWGQGWPVDRSADMQWVRASRSGAKWQVHREIAPIVEYLVNEVERRGYLFDHGPDDVDDEWGYNNRPIRGKRVPSNHSWGLAIDVDAQEYPFGVRRNPPQWIIDLFDAYLFDHGGAWRKPDGMHFEFRGTPREARWLVAALAAHHLQGTPPARPSTVPPPYNPPARAAVPFTSPAPGVPMKFFISDPSYGIRLVITDGTCVMDYGVTKLEQLDRTDTRIGGPMTPAAFAQFCAKYPGGRTAMGHLPS